jgi:hypothetical protein
VSACNQIYETTQPYHLRPCDVSWLLQIPERDSLLVFIVDRAHERSGRREDIIHENENSLLGCELDTFSTYQLFPTARIDELT